MTRPLPPLARAALAFAAGILGGLRLPTPDLLSVLIAASVVALIATLPLAWRRWRRGAGAVALLAFGLAGLLLGAVAADRARGDCRARLPDGAWVEARGAFAALAFQDAGVPFHVETIRLGGAVIACEGLVRIYPGGAVDTLPDAGAEVVIRGRWRTWPHGGEWPRPPRWSGALMLDSVRVISTAGAGHHPLLAARGAAQERLRRLFDEQNALAEALLLARDAGLDGAVRERFVRAGLSHLLAISGLHVGLIAATLLLVGRLLRCSKRTASIAAALATISYVLFIGAPPPATRAAVLVLLGLGSRLRQRPADPFALLAAAALLLLTLDPLAILGPGFQLSFAGVIGILVLRPRFLDALPSRVPRALREGVATSAAATLATAPIAALHFGRVAPIGIVANLAAIPLTALAVPAVALALAVGYVAGPLAALLADGAAVLLWALDRLAAAAAAVPFGHAYVPRDAVGGWVLATIAAALVAGWLARRGTRRGRIGSDTVGAHGRAPRHRADDGSFWNTVLADGLPAPGRGGGRARGRPTGIRPAVRRLAAGGVALALLTAWPLAVRSVGGNALEIHMIDVGQGDAIAIQVPEAGWLLVDAGVRRDDWDAGRERVVPFLLRHGVRRLRALVLTHPHADHIGGAAAVLDVFEVGAVIDPGVPTGSEMYLSLVHRVGRSDARWVEARAGRTLRLGDAVLRFLHPSTVDARAKANHFSVVFVLEYGRFRALFLGDAPAEVERRLVRRRGRKLRVDVLKVAHHGSATSSSLRLLEVAAPEIALISVGRHNRYGHPHPWVIQRLERRGIRVYRTDRDGTITVRADGRGHIRVETTR